MKGFVAAGVAAALAAAGTAAFKRTRRSNGQGESRDAFRRYIEAWESGKVEDLDGVLGRRYRGHFTGLTGSEDRDRNRLEEQIGAFHDAFPDASFTVEDEVVANGRVAARISAHGTHAETGNETTMSGITIARMQRGRIVEEWSNWDYVGLAQQVGAASLQPAD
jgi:predicted ester cyclase